MRILILSDSLGLPRNVDGQLVSYEDTYVYLLKKKYPQHEILHVGIGGATMLDIKTQSLYYPVAKPNLVFIQCGIVDCAPRAFSKFESKIIRELKLKKVFNPFVSFLRKYRKHTYTSPKKFGRYINEINSNFASATQNVYYIGIIPGSNDYEMVLPNIIKQINLYNDILQKEGIRFIDNKDFPMDGILPDHHHLNKKGNLLIFKKIDEIIASQ